MLAKFNRPASWFAGGSYNRSYKIEQYVSSVKLSATVSSTIAGSQPTIQVRRGTGKFSDEIVYESPPLAPNNKGVIEHELDLEGLDGVFVLTTGGGYPCFPMPVVFGLSAPAGQWIPNITAFFDIEYRKEDPTQPGYTFVQAPDGDLDLSANAIKLPIPPKPYPGTPEPKFERSYLVADNINLGVSEKEMQRQWYGMLMPDGTMQHVILPHQVYGQPDDLPRNSDYWRCGPFGTATFGPETQIVPLIDDEILQVSPAGRIGHLTEFGTQTTLLGFRSIPGKPAPLLPSNSVSFPSMNEDETQSAIEQYAASELTEHVGAVQGPGGPQLIRPYGACRDPNSPDHVFISDEFRIIRLSISTKEAIVVAGSGGAGNATGAGLDARFNLLKRLTYSEPLGKVLICDDRNHRVCTMDPVTYEVEVLIHSAWNMGQIIASWPTYSGNTQTGGLNAQQRRVECSGAFGDAKFGHPISIEHLTDTTLLMTTHHDAAFWIVDLVTQYIQHVYQFIVDQQMVKNAGGGGAYALIAVDRHGALGEPGVIFMANFQIGKVLCVDTHADGNPTLKVVKSSLFGAHSKQRTKSGSVQDAAASGYPLGFDMDNVNGCLYYTSASGFGAYRVRARDDSFDGETPDWDLYYAGQKAWEDMTQGRQSLLASVGPYGFNRLGAEGLPQYIGLDADGRRAMIGGVWGRSDLLDQFNEIDYFLSVCWSRGFAPGTATPYAVDSTAPPVEPPIDPPVEPPEPPAEIDMVLAPRDQVEGMIRRMREWLK